MDTDGHDPSPSGPDEEPTAPTPAVDATMLNPAVGPPPGPPAGPSGATPAGSGGDRRKLALIIGAVFLVGLLIGGIAIALTHSSTSKSAATDSTTTTLFDPSSTTSSTAVGDSTSVSTDTTIVGSSTTPGSPTTGTPPPPTSPSPPPPTAPSNPTTPPPTASTAVRVDSISGSTNNQCSAGPAPGVSFTVAPSNPQVTIRWSTSFATSVDLSVDGPGVYQSNIGTSGSITIAYGCPGPHSYTITAHGQGGTSAAKSISISTAHTTSACVTGEPCSP